MGTTAANAADLEQGLGSGHLVGTIRIQHFDGREKAASRSLEFYQGAQATWLVSRDPQQAGQVDVALVTPAAFDTELGLTSQDS
jgi:hypothetical protein